MKSALRWLWIGAPLAAVLLGSGLAWLVDATPPLDDETVLLGAAVLLALVLQLWLSFSWRSARTLSWERFLRGSFAAFLASLVVYNLLLFLFSVRRDDNRHVRVPLGLIYTADFDSYQADHPEVSAAAWVAGGDRPEMVYANWSLQLMQLVFAVAWFALALSLAAFLTSAGTLRIRRGDGFDPQLAVLRERVESWPSAAPPEMRSALEAAMRTLAEHGNKHGAILTVAPLFEGREGFLGAVATASGTRLERSLWADQIEELRTAGHLPPHAASELHSLRIYSNDARHNKRRLTFDDARRTLESAVRCVEWYLYEFPQGPRLAAPDAGLPPAFSSAPSPPAPA